MLSFEWYVALYFTPKIFCVQVYAGKHVVFGKVIRGYEVVKQVAEVPVDEKDRPLSPVVISNCGELELRKPPGAMSPLYSRHYFNFKHHSS